MLLWMVSMKDDVFNFLVATDQLDEFLGNEMINVYQSETDSYIKMKVIGKYKFIGDNVDLDLTPGKIYNRVYRSDDPNGFYIVDDSGEDYLYSTEYFEKIG